MLKAAFVTMSGVRAEARRLAASVLLLACVLPAPVQAITLDQLIAQPIECLLQLTVTPACGAAPTCAHAAGERDG